jgi:two-component sensor histidine kinase
VDEAIVVCGEAAGRIVRAGPALALTPKQALSIALVLHELCTNAVKHGALSEAGGGVDLSWRLDETGRLELSWREHDGPLVRPPDTRGFGTVLLEKAVVHDVGGEAEMKFHQRGLHYSLTLPMSEGEAHA